MRSRNLSKQRIRPRLLLTLLLSLLLVLDLSHDSPAGAQAPTTEVAPPSSETVAKTFDGLWTTSYGPMRLLQINEVVYGIYKDEDNATIAGKLEDDRLVFTYREVNARGEGWFELIGDSDQFEGKWRANGSEDWDGWIGTRTTTAPGKIWLIVLEAHWEVGLAEPEYAFGDMLRSYFTMEHGRHVEVRHRFFHDIADFSRWCGEVPFIAEPVVLLVSSHGTPGGIRIAGKTIGAQIIADSLRYAANLKLLHLSGCAMMAGEIPAEIHRRLSQGPRFPISGYSTDVDWDASAIADFTFLSFLLMHEMSPKAAAIQACLVSPFIGDQETEGAAFVPLGLKVLEPPTVTATAVPRKEAPATSDE